MKVNAWLIHVTCTGTGAQVGPLLVTCSKKLLSVNKPCGSVTRAVMVYMPGVVGTPLMVRVAALNVSPRGSAERIEYVSKVAADSLSVAGGKVKLNPVALVGTALSGN